MGSHAQVKAPGFAAWLRRHSNRRPLAIGAIAAGTVLFLIASLTTPLAGADPTHRSSGRAAGTDLSGLLPFADQQPPSATPAAPPSTSAVPRASATRKPPPLPAVSGLAANGIPSVALNAYRVAAARMDHADPECGIDWALLAGIGRVESDHGQFRGAVLHADGTSAPRIIGPALDGVHYTYVPAPPNGAELDGDARYAHALGAMQFIPQTWATYGADANGDGVADVFNINDAALGAARYLCAAGGDLRSHDNLVRAVRAYNDVDAYVATVLALADAYRRGIPISGIPIGNISGALPPVHQTGTPPPANPGGPTAVESSGSRTSSTTAPGPSSSGSTSAPPPAPSGGGSATSSAPAPKPTIVALPTPTPTPTPAPTAASSPTPSPTKSCDPLSHLLHLC